MRIFFRFVLPLVSAILIIIGCVIYLTYDSSINSGTDNVSYNDIVYERFDLSYNMQISESNSKYIGDFAQIYAYGQELLWDVRELNSDANILYSAHATWVKPGYVLPTEFGEELASAEYVVSEGIDFLVIPDEYKEEVTHLVNFEGSVKLEDIIETEASDVTVSEEALENCGEIRFDYKNHADISLIFYIYGVDGDYYLDVRNSTDGTHEWFKIKPEYVGVLTSAMTGK